MVKEKELAYFVMNLSGHLFLSPVGTWSTDANQCAIFDTEKEAEQFADTWGTQLYRVRSVDVNAPVLKGALRLMFGLNAK